MEESLQHRGVDGSGGCDESVEKLCRRLRVVCLEQVPLAPRTTWKIGGPARWLVQPANLQALQHVLSALPPDLPRLVLGGGSNLLIDDNGFHGVVLDLKHHLNRLSLSGASVTEQGTFESVAVDACAGLAVEGEEVLLQAEAGANTRAVAHFARLQGLAGAEFLGGIPGSVGGALRMNAGAYGGEMRHIVVDVDLLDAGGTRRTLPVAQLGMGYRQTRIPTNWIFLAARLRLRRDDPAAIRTRMRAMNVARRQSQPLRFPSAGSTFKNPPTGPKAWQWVDAAGLRGATEGAAQVSTQHSNFVINRGGARSRDVQILIDRIREQVLQVGGVRLALEVGVVTPSGLMAP